jgi:hypothetical protein
MVTTVIPPVNAEISVALEVILAHLLTVRCRRILCGTFQERECVLWSVKLVICQQRSRIFVSSIVNFLYSVIRSVDT